MKYITCDTETAGLSARYDASVPVYCVSFCDGTDTFSLSCDEAIEFINGIKPGYKWVFFNAPFDVSVLRIRGAVIEPGSYDDAQLMAYMWRPDEETSLQYWGNKLGEPKTDIYTELRSRKLIPPSVSSNEMWEQVDLLSQGEAHQLLERYCEQDCRVTYKLHQEMLRHIEANKKLSKAYYDIELPYVECIMEMNSTGAYIDCAGLFRWIGELEFSMSAMDEVIANVGGLVPEAVKWDATTRTYVPQCKEYKGGSNKNCKNLATYYLNPETGSSYASEPNMVYDHCKMTELSASKDSQLWWLLMRDGIKPTAFTDTGLPDSSAAVIEQIDHPVAKVINESQRLTKLYTMAMGILTEVDDDGYIHSNFNQTVAVTGRLSSSNPNLQNIPVRTSDGKKLRSFFTAPPGYTLCVGDLDRIELVVLAYYLELLCNEKRMADAARQGLDIHQANADAWGCSRPKAKNGIFAVNYGAQANKLSETILCTVEEAQALLDAINKGMPAIAQLKEMVWGAARKAKGYINGLLGHSLYYPAINSYNKWDRLLAERQVFNALIQNGAGAIFKLLTLPGMEIVHEYGGVLVMVVHDELHFYVPTEHAEECCHRMTELFNNKTLLSGKDKNGNEFYVPISAEFKPGSNWNDAKGE